MEMNSHTAQGKGRNSWVYWKKEIQETHIQNILSFNKHILFVPMHFHFQVLHKDTVTRNNELDNPMSNNVILFHNKHKAFYHFTCLECERKN